MKEKYTLLLLIQLIQSTCVLAEPAITIPWVGYSYSGNYFAGYEGKIVGTDGDKTTYEVNCPASDTTCIPFDSDSPMTLIAGSNTYDIIYTDPWEYTSSGCTFAGAPTPTTATCSYTQTLQMGTHSTSRTNTYNVPASTVYREMYSATLAVAGSASSSSTATKTTSSTEVITTQTSSRDGSSTAGATTPATTTAETTAATGNGAYKSSAPMMLMGGAIAIAMNV